jgi:hypothetical protein
MSRMTDPLFDPDIQAPSPNDIQSIYHTPASTYLDLPDADPLDDRQSIPDTIVRMNFHSMAVFLRFL